MIRKEQIVEVTREASMLAAVVKLALPRLVQQRPFSLPRQLLGFRKVQQPPSLRPVHIDHALRRPDPIVFGQARPLHVPTLDNIDMPLHAAKVNSPCISRARRTRDASGHLGHSRPRQFQLHRPLLRAENGIVQCPIDRHRRPEPL